MCKSSETTLKAVGSPNTGTANVLSFYQAQGPGTYKIVLQELLNCGNPDNVVGAQVSDTQLVVEKSGCTGGCSDETANQSAVITAVNATKVSDLLPAFTISGGVADAATINWTLLFNTDVVNCVAVRLRAPNGVTETTLKAIGAPNSGSANVLSFYQAQGAGKYLIVLQELASCGADNTGARITTSQMQVSCP